MNVRKVLTFFAVATLILFSSCSDGIQGYAVMLWPEPDTPFSAGEILPIVGTSRLQETITINVAGETSTLSTTRLALFDDETTARAFAEEFSPWQDRYARSTLTALPVRTEPDRTSTRLYRLRDGEMVKLLGRTDEQSDEGGLVDYWYHALTENGVTGWIFGRNLELVSAGGRSLEPGDDRDQLDRLVRDMAEVSWRPRYFREMTRTGRIDLDRFLPRYGLFGDFEESSFRIVMPAYRKDFSYSGYSSVGRNAVSFRDSDLELELIGEDQLRATFLLNDRRREEVFVIFDENIDEIIRTEQARRAQLLDQFLSRGDGLISTAFGSIELGLQGSLSWEGYERLVPDILPPGFDGNGSLRFSLFIHDSLRSRYDGALRIVMRGGMSTPFLYTLTDDGVRFVYLPPGLIDQDQIVRSEPSTPVVLFFRFFQN